MRHLTLILFSGIGFASGVLAALIGLHATEDFERLEPLAVLWSDHESADRHGATAEREENADNSVAVSSKLFDLRLAHRDPAPDADDDNVDAPGAGNVLPVSVTQEFADDPSPAAEAASPEAATVAAPGAAATQVASITDADLAEIQTLLLIRGFDPGPIDGVLGPQTRDAIRAFERSQGMAETGSASPLLLKVLTGHATPAPAKAERMAAAETVTAEADAPRESARDGSKPPMRLLP